MHISLKRCMLKLWALVEFAKCSQEIVQREQCYGSSSRNWIVLWDNCCQTHSRTHKPIIYTTLDNVIAFWHIHLAMCCADASFWVIPWAIGTFKTLFITWSSFEWDVRCALGVYFSQTLFCSFEASDNNFWALNIFLWVFCFGRSIFHLINVRQ